MNGFLWRTAGDVYGALRGYNRRAIRRAVETNHRRAAEDLAREAEALFARRVREALARFPDYAERVRAHGFRAPAGEGPIEAAALPVWTRDDQRRFFERTPGPPVPGAFTNRTGGSSGVPLRYWTTRESWEWRTAVSDRGYGWAGAERGARSVYVWGTAIHPPGRVAALKGWLAARLQNRVYFDSFRFGPDEQRRCCATIERVRPRAIVGYAGNLAELARFVRANPGALRHRADAVVTAAEGLPERMRDLLREYLAEDVFVSYGSREFMLIAMECRAHRGLHISSDNLRVEVVDDAGGPVAPGELGRIVVTDLRNAANPFIRYEIGDLGRPALPDEPCPCGLPFPRLLCVEGRSQEFIELPDDTRLTALFIPHLMKEFPWVEGYQVEQQDSAGLVMNLVTAQPLTPVQEESIRVALQPKVGAAMKLVFRRVPSLQRNVSGKTPIVVKSRPRA